MDKCPFGYYILNHEPTHRLIDESSSRTRAKLSKSRNILRKNNQSFKKVKSKKEREINHKKAYEFSQNARARVNNGEAENESSNARDAEEVYTTRETQEERRRRGNWAKTSGANSKIENLTLKT